MDSEAMQGTRELSDEGSMEEMMTKKPDPKKAVYLKPNQRRRRRVRESKPAASWEPHCSDQALDAWGVALRTLRQRGVDVSK